MASETYPADYPGQHRSTPATPLGMVTANRRMDMVSRESDLPLVSVIIPTYNRAWALVKAVQSVFDQTFRPIECLVVDDGSTDDTAKLMRELDCSTPKGVELRYFQKPNGGANSARNWGLIESRGELICFLDSDDWLLPDSVKTRAEILIQDSSVDFCYGLCSVRDEDGNEIRMMNFPWPKPGQARIVPYLFDTNAPLIRRRICSQAGLWREDDGHGQEYEYFARIKSVSRNVAFVDNTLSVYIRHDKDSIFDMSNREFILGIYRMLWAIKSLVIFSKYDNPQERKALADEFHKIAKQLYRLEDYGIACMALKESLLLSWTLRRFMHLGCVSVFRFATRRRVWRTVSNRNALL